MILVTGASGFIGSHLLPALSSVDKLKCIVRRPGKLRLPPEAEIVADLSQKLPWDDYLEGVDTVIHMAALLRKSGREAMQRVNVDATRGLVEACKRKNVRHFIFLSTENALREDLSDPYADTKRQAENIVRTFEHSLILRPCFVYGRGDNHGLGRLVEMTEKRFLVPLFGGLKSSIQPVYIDDMVEYLVRAVTRKIEGAYVIAGPDMINLNAFIRKVCAFREQKRLFLTIPYPLVYLSALAGECLGPSAGWGRSQLRNIYHSRTYSIEETITVFGYAPRSLTAGLKLWFDGV